jgi:sec-independent protein translocase protein TatA
VESGFALARQGPKRVSTIMGGHAVTRRGEIVMLNNIGIPGILLIAVVVLVLFGRGKVSSLMGEVGKGISAFKKGVKEETAELEKNAEEARDVTPSEKDKA